MQKVYRVKPATFLSTQKINEVFQREAFMKIKLIYMIY